MSEQASEQRHSIRRIADDYGIHHTWVTKWFKEWGVVLGSQRAVKDFRPGSLEIDR